MKEKGIRVLSLQPGEKPARAELVNTLEVMQQFVGGLIECIPLDADPDDGREILLVANDEGKLMGLAPNRWLWDGLDLLAEPAFIAAGDSEGNICSLSDVQMERYSQQFAQPVLTEAEQ